MMIFFIIIIFLFLQNASRLISHEIASVNMFEHWHSVFLLSLTLNKNLGSNRPVVVTMFKTHVGFTVHN